MEQLTREEALKKIKELENYVRYFEEEKDKLEDRYICGLHKLWDALKAGREAYGKGASPIECWSYRVSLRGEKLEVNLMITEGSEDGKSFRKAFIKELMKE